MREASVSGDPFELIASRAEGFKRLGADRAICRAPTRADKRPSVSIARGHDGRVLVHDFGGDSIDTLCAGWGIAVSDLFPPRAETLTPGESARMRQAAKQSGWAAALRVLTYEAAVVIAAAAETVAGHPLSAIDTARLRLALQRLTSARQILAVPAHEGRRFSSADNQAQADAEQYRADLERAT